MNLKFFKLIKKINSSNFILKRISFYLFIICVLLGLIFFKINEMSDTLYYLSNNNDSQCTTTEKDAYNNVLEVFTEDDENLGEYLPQYNDLIEENTTKQNIEETTNTEKTSTEYKETLTSNVETTSSKKTETQSSSTTTETSTAKADTSAKITFVINKNSKKIHYYDCSFVNRMKEENKEIIKLNKSELNNYLNNGYSLCNTCGG